MKRTILWIWIGLLFAGAVQAGDKVITKDVGRLPEVSRTFIRQYLPGKEVSHIKIEKGWTGIKKYEVILTDGIEVEFDDKGEWKEIDGNRRAIPVGFLSAKIRDYLKTDFPDEAVVSVERDSRKFEIKLSNRFELTFNRKGDLIDIER